MGWYGVALAGGVLLLTGCTDAPDSTPTPASRPTPTLAPTASAPPATEAPRPRPRLVADVRHLAGAIGPRLATGASFRRAADWVTERFADLGYRVRRQAYAVPAGSSWGVQVPAGHSANVVAVPRGFDDAAPYVLVGAHLDTVAVAPGAEDNASGVAVLLETARRVAAAGETQVVLVAFGGEEPRGPGDLHHFGSRQYVRAMGAAERRHLRAMVSLDRVGVGPTTVAWVAGTSPRVRDELLAAARRLGVRTAVEANTGSDHESFADAGLPAARLGGAPYAAYHSAADVPAVVDPDQLERTTRVLCKWLTHRGG